MKKEDKIQAILVIVLGFLVMYLVISKPYFIFEWLKKTYFLYASVGIGVVALVFPVVGDWILKGWFKIGEVLGFINTRILLSAIFFLFLTPFAFLQKLFSNPNSLSLKNKDESVYHTRNHEYKPDDFENIW
jgi:hypothetical protein